MYLIGFYSKKNLFKLNKFDYYKKSFKDLKSQGISIIYFYQEDPAIELSQETINEINDIGVKIIGFSDSDSIISYLQTLPGKIFINTFEEQEIQFTNTIRSSIGQKTTDDPDIFLNKYLQRKIIGAHYPDTIVQYKKLSIQEAKNISEEEFPPFPCIIKPTGGIQSSGVCKVYDFKEYHSSLEITLNAFSMLQEKELPNQSILIEEFIDGKMYTIDYYVDENQNITISKPVFVKLGIDYGINDFCNVSRFIGHDIESEVNEEDLRDFIKKTVIGGGIRNTFVHHEFKITPQGQMKTIEINGRIGGFRLDMYQLGYGMNLLIFPFLPNNGKTYILEQNIAMFALYPKQTSTFHGYHQDIIEQISKLPSFHRLNKGIKTLGETIGLTRNGYGKVGSVELANSDGQQFKKDVDFLEKNYFTIINTNPGSD